MKKLLLLSGICLLSRFAFAQSAVIDSAWMPHTGDKYYIFQLLGDTSVNPNDTGINVVWDFKTVYHKGMAPDDSFDFALPASRYISPLNPYTNLVSGDSSTYTCFIKNSFGLQMCEFKENFLATTYGSVHKIFVKPEFWMHDNFYLHREFEDTSRYYYVWNNNSTDSANRGKKTTYEKYDGYGTLKIAGLEYDSAIRIHKFYTIKDTINDNSYDSTIFENDAYDWYVPSIHAPLLRLIKIWYIKAKHFSRDTINVTTWVRLTQPVPGMGSSPQGSGIQGSNATFIGNSIRISGLTADNITYALFDEAGRLIKEGKPKNTMNGSSQITSLNISQGIYFLRIQNSAGETKSIKLIKAR